VSSCPFVGLPLSRLNQRLLTVLVAQHGNPALWEQWLRLLGEVVLQWIVMVQVGCWRGCRGRMVAYDGYDLQSGVFKGSACTELSRVE
jgi:hypothetical protein